MKRTYGGRRDAGAGAIHYRDLLQSVDSSSTAFDALSIKHLKQLKRDTSCSYATWSNQQTVRKKPVKRAHRKDRSTLCNVFDNISSEAPAESCLTPDKSLRVNRTPDPFDLLRSPNENLHENLPVQLLCSSPVNSTKFTRKIHATMIPSDESSQNDSPHNSDAIKENSINYSNICAKTSHPVKNMSLYSSSDMHKYKLNVEDINEEDALSKSIKTVVNNASFLKALIKRKSLCDQNLTKDNILTPTKQPEPLTSTPYMQKNKKVHVNNSMNVSPIHNNATKLKKISVINASPMFKTNLHPSIFAGSNIEYNDSNGCKMPTSNYFKSNDNTVPQIKEPLQTSLRSNECEYSNKSIISVHSDFDSEPFLGFTNVPEPNVNILSEAHTSNDLLNKVDHSSCESINCDNSTKQPKSCSQNNSINATLSSNKSKKSLNISESTDDSTSTDSYTTCSSIDKSFEQNLKASKNIEPYVCIERLDDSLFYRHYENMNNYCNSNNSCLDEVDLLKNLQESNEIDSSYINDCSVQKSSNEESCDGCALNSINSSKNSITETCRQNYSQLDANSTDKNPEIRESNENNVEEARESISISSESDCSDEISHNESRPLSSETSGNSDNINSSISTSSERTEIDNKNIQGMTSFVTTRRRNVMDESVMILLDDSSDGMPDIEVADLGAECVTMQGHVDTKTDIPIDIQAKPKGPPLSPGNSEANRFDAPLNTIPLSHSVRPSIPLQPGKKWERSLSMYRRQTMLQDQSFHEPTIKEESSPVKSDYQDSQVVQHSQKQKGTFYFNDSVCGQRYSVLCNPRRSTIRIVKEAATARASFSTCTLVNDDIGFLSEDCDDTLAELSKLSISDTALDVTVLEKLHGSARDDVLRRCNQTDVLPFDECYPDLVLKNCRKIGEGVYGEVFLYRGHDGRGRVMKVVPVEGHMLVNGEHQKTFQEVRSEVVIAMELSALRAPIVDIERHCDDQRDNSGLDLSTVENATDTFNEVLTVRCVYGSYPARLLDLWELYDESSGSENDNPAVLPPDQLYMVLELANAGQDLEGYQFNSAEQAYALFYQVAFALAVGEESHQLEHRDLHWGNVLIQPTDQKFARYVLRGRLHNVPRCGVAATIIDYTLSRVTLPLAAGERATLYNDLGSDEGLFAAVGDYQFDVYRHMREKNGNDWEKFEPYSNILWLHYTVDKMVTALRYKRTNTKIHKHYIGKLKGIRNRLLDYSSAVHFVLADQQI